MLNYNRFVAAVSVVLLALTTACSQAEQSQDTSSTPIAPKSTAPTRSSVASKATKAVPSKASAALGDRFQTALDTGMSAAKLAQSAQSKEEWKLVSSRWQSAIKLLKAVPNSSQNHAKAQKKVTEYQKYLAYAQKQGSSKAKLTSKANPSSSATPQSVNVQNALDTAMGAAVITQSAQSQDDWNLVVNRWQTALNLLKAVPSSSPDYAIAQKKIAEYQRNLAYAQQQQKGRPKLTNAAGTSSGGT